MEFSAVLEVYFGLIIHSMGFDIPHTPHPRIPDHVLDSAPPTWTLAPLPELHAGVDFSNREELIKAFTPYRNRQAVVFKGFLTHQKAMGSWAAGFKNLTEPWWTVEHLGKELAGIEVRVFQNYSCDDSIVWTDFGEYANTVMKDPDAIQYARAVSEHWEVKPEMMAAVDEKLFSEMAGRYTWWDDMLSRFHNWIGRSVIFVSGRKPTTRLHSDVGESFVVHTEGQKHWRFFNPDSSLLFRPRGMVKSVGFGAGFDVWAPDFEADPQLRLARGWETNVDTGDLLYFPSQTWHAVRNVGDRNVIFDYGTFDFARALSRNWPMTLISMLHPGAAVDLIRYCALGAESRDGHYLPQKYACGKEVYFQGYKPKRSEDL